MENTEAARGDHSFAELRAMMTGDQPASTTPASEPVTETPADETDQPGSTETAPASGSDEGQEDGKARGTDGKFKATDAEPGDTPNVQKRIAKAVKAQREAERQAEEVRRQLAELQGSRPAADSGKTAQPATGAKTKPELKDFDSYEAYNEALIAHTVEQREAQRETDRQQRERQSADAKLQAEHLERVDAARVKYEDFDEKLSTLNVPISRELDRAIRESPYGPEVVYWTASHPEEAQRIAALSPARQVVEFGKLEAQFEKPATEKTTPAKKPLPKAAANVGGGSSSAGKEPDLADPKLSMTAFKRLAGQRMKRG